VCRLAVKTRRTAHHALLALEPHGGSSSAALTMRHTKASLPLSIPTISRGTSSVPRAFCPVTACWIPRRCQRRTPGSGTGDTTPGWITASCCVQQENSRPRVAITLALTCCRKRSWRQSGAVLGSAGYAVSRPCNRKELGPIRCYPYVDGSGRSRPIAPWCLVPVGEVGPGRPRRHHW